MESLSDVYERGRPQPWVPDYDPSMLDAIIGFRLPVDTVEAKFKLSQNRSAADRDAVIRALDGAGPGSRAVAGLMREVSGAKQSGREGVPRRTRSTGE